MSSQKVVRQRRAGGARRAAVLGQVVQVLAERGYSGTRFTDVSQVSGLAVSTLQGYFGSREDMLIEALAGATSGEVAALQDVAATFADPWQQIVALIDRGLSTNVATWRMLMEFWTASAHDVELREHAAVLAAQYRAPFAAAIDSGAASGAFSPRFDSVAIVDVAVAAIDGLMFPVVLGHRASDDLDFRDALLAQLAFVLGIDGANPGA